MMLVRTAKSCRSGAPMQASSLREEAQATVSNKPGLRGEREVSRKAIARRMPGDSRCDRGDYARVLFYFAREAAGALGARHSLRPLLSRVAKRFLQNSGESRREIAEVCGEDERATFSAVIAREGGRSSIPETTVMESRSRGVLDTPLPRGMTMVRAEHRPGMTLWQPLGTH